MSNRLINQALKLTAISGAAALAASALTPVMAEEAEGEKAEMTRGEERLARMLEGREAGEPVRCIRQRPNDRMRVIDDTAYVYGSGRTIYVQRTNRPRNIDRDDTLVIRRFSASQLCRLDPTHTVDPVSGMYTGAVFFEDFVPYTRVEKEEG